MCVCVCFVECFIVDLTEQLTNLAMDQGEEVNVRRCPIADLVLFLQIIKFKKYFLKLIKK